MTIGHTPERKLPPFWHFHRWHDLPYFGSFSYPVPIQHCRCGMIRRWVTPEAAAVFWPDEKLAAIIDTASSVSGK